MTVMTTIVESSNAPTQRQYPPLAGSLLLPGVIDFHIHNNSTIPIYVYADDKAPGGLTEISFLEFGRAAHRAAHTLRPKRAGSEGEVVALIANTDSLLYHAVVAGMIIAGLVPFAMSPRNSPPAVADMMKKTGCRRVVTIENTHRALVEGVRREVTALEVTELPSYSRLYPKLGKETIEDQFEFYPQPPSWPQLDQPALYLHSSGSTGFPKPIAHSHRTQMQWLAQRKAYVHSGATDKRKRPQRLGAMSLPSFHSYGLAIQLYAALGGTITVVVYPPTSVNDPNAQPIIPTSDNILDCLRKTDANILMTVPSLLEHWTTSEEAVNLLKSLDYVLYGGGPLPHKIGDALHAAGVPIATEYGGTEFGCPVLMPTRKHLADGDWLWLRFSDNVDIRWVPQGDDTYECQILSSDVIQMAVENLPDVKGYATSDVFVKHPSKAGLWKLTVLSSVISSVGRTDDVLTLASGEKTVPAPMESIIGSSPHVQGVVMFGRERNQVGVLVEPGEESIVNDEDKQQVMEFREKIWPWVEEANKTAPAFSRIFKDMIIVTRSDKPMPRAGKGTVQKKSALQLYDAEINVLYESVESRSSSTGSPENWTEDTLNIWLREHATRVNLGAEIDVDIDLFSQGFDSLSATYLRNRIISALRQSSDAGLPSIAERVAPNFVFDNPTIRSLSKRLAGLIRQHDSDGPNDKPLHAHVTAIEAMIEKYSVGLDSERVVMNDSRPDEAVVLLTGSTGGLGSYLLAQLLQNTKVSRVYAFNRPSKAGVTSERRQTASFRDKNLSLELLRSDKLVYIEGDAAQKECGLHPITYDQIRESVNIIIHNSWRLDFNLSLASFEPIIRGTRNLVDLARSSVHRSCIRFLFTSSIASAHSWDYHRGPFPEEVQLDAGVAVGAGYGESKYVAERLVAKSGLQATSFRIGQIAGGPNGAWASTDWLPIIVKSSLTLGVFPDAEGRVSWIPAHEVSATILDIAFTKNRPPAAINIVHPRPALWSEVMGEVRVALVEEKHLDDDVLRLVPFEDWFFELEKRAREATERNFHNIPAVKLLEYFRDMAQADGELRRLGHSNREVGGIAEFATEKGQGFSRSLRELAPIGMGEAKIDESQALNDERVAINDDRDSSVQHN
ncbi:putative aminoadipate reductase [Leucogyrophana mollusca]|uniref:Aminoadipate reductase n=1 Tax=Leucogyrophana mollusca TaxID=85980 RepID=A0ACB8BXE9_9AGAM|nr:putative aminoadipate reductase [Leucogyrophana mollusca]